MRKNKLYDAFISLDVHKNAIDVAIACSERAGEIRFWGNIPKNIIQLDDYSSDLLNYFLMITVYKNCNY